mmetsp:Transcript_19559/g.25993  ORF Transcript_19559/g.25993 Transcript_19559/m.25993 type:complete len:80 (+) Transcript_19559:678-917(+)
MYVCKQIYANHTNNTKHAHAQKYDNNLRNKEKSQHIPLSSPRSGIRIFTSSVNFDLSNPSGNPCLFVFASSPSSSLLNS